jgi:hypothetical protein
MDKKMEQKKNSIFDIKRKVWAAARTTVLLKQKLF